MGDGEGRKKFWGAMGNPGRSLEGDWEGEEDGEVERRPAGVMEKARVSPIRWKEGVGLWAQAGRRPPELLTIGAETAAALRGGGGTAVRGGVALGRGRSPGGLPPQDVDDLGTHGEGRSPGTAVVSEPLLAQGSCPQ